MLTGTLFARVRWDLTVAFVNAGSATRINTDQRRSTSMTAWAKACGASCGMLWPTPPVMSR